MRRLVACLFIDNILCGKFVPSVPIMTNDNLTVTLVSFFVPEFGNQIYNHFLNILRLFDVLPNFPSVASEKKRDY